MNVTTEYIQGLYKVTCISDVEIKFFAYYTETKSSSKLK